MDQALPQGPEGEGIVRRLGLLGGMSWESSVEYERTINEYVREHLGGTTSADLLIRSFNFADIEALQEAGDWQQAAQILAGAARHLQDGGAEAIVVCTNTMHVVAPQIQAAIDIPLLHIADATAQAAQDAGLTTVALLGTRYTMEQPFYAGRLAEHGLDVLIPDPGGRTVIHDVIYEELVRGVINPLSRAAYLREIDVLITRGAQGVIAGCTEIELLVHADDLDVPLLPTARLHAEAAARFALQ